MNESKHGGEWYLVCINFLIIHCLVLMFFCFILILRPHVSTLAFQFLLCDFSLSVFYHLFPQLSFPLLTPPELHPIDSVSVHMDFVLPQVLLSLFRCVLSSLCCCLCSQCFFGLYFILLFFRTLFPILAPACSSGFSLVCFWFLFLWFGHWFEFIFSLFKHFSCYFVFFVFFTCCFI